MAYDEELADRVRAVLGREVTTEQRMFGGLAFLVGGHMAVAASGRGGLMVRVDRGEADHLCREPGVEPVEMGAGRVMRGWVRVDSPVIEDDVVLRTWVGRGLACARSVRG